MSRNRSQEDPRVTSQNQSSWLFAQLKYGKLAMAYRSFPPWRPPSDQPHSRPKYDKMSSVNDTALATQLWNLTRDPQFASADTVMVLTDNRPLSVHTPGLAYLKHTMPWLIDRTRHKKNEQWYLLAVPLDASTGLHQVQVTWAVAFIMEFLTVGFPSKHFIVMDHDAAFTSLFDVQDLINMVSKISAFAHCPTVLNETPAQLEVPQPGIILVSENNTISNAGIIFMLKSANTSNSPTGPDQWQESIHEARTAFIATGRTARKADPTAQQQYLQATPEKSRSRLWRKAHHQALFRDTPLYMCQAQKPSDFAIAWALTGRAINYAAWPVPIEGDQYPKNSKLDGFSEETRAARSVIGAWAGPCHEQGVLPTLQAFDSDTVCVAYLPGSMQFMRTRLQHHPMNKQVDLHPSPAAVHYYGGHKNAMAQLDELPHWFLLEESLFGYRHQGDGCLQIIPPAVSGDIHSVSHSDTATSSTEPPLVTAPPGLELPLHKARLLPRATRHNSPALLLSAQQAVTASAQREALF